MPPRTTLFIAAACLIIAAGCSILAPPPAFKGALYGAPAPPPEFSLPATTGGTFTLSESRGKITLIFFGYTLCPDVCPQTLGTLRSAFSKLSPEARGQVQLVFITVDPNRDTLELLGGYLARFDSGYIGVVPDEAELESLEAGYALYAEVEPPDADGNYFVGHTGLTYVIDKVGNLRLGFFDGMSSDDIVHDLEILAEE